MRKCWNWQTGQTKDLVVIAIVWVQVPSSAEQKLLLMQEFFTLQKTSSNFPAKQKAFRAGSHCNGGELCCWSDPPQAENSAQKKSEEFCFEFPLIFLFCFLSEFFCNLYLYRFGLTILGV